MKQAGQRRLLWTGLIIALLTVPLLAACGGDNGQARDLLGEFSEPGPLSLRLELQDGAYFLRWSDPTSGTPYRISGTAVYGPVCEEEMSGWTDNTQFGNQLGIGVTEYRLPAPRPAFNIFLKELTVDFSTGSQTADSLTFVADTPRC